MEASGLMSVGEPAAALAYVKARRGLSPRQVKAILLSCMLALGIPVALWFSETWLDAVVAVEATIGGLILGIVLVHLLSGPAMRKAFALRGQGHKLPLTLRLKPDALVYELGAMTTTSPWSSVTDLYQTQKHWVFLVQSSAMVLPRRFFPSPEAERAFIVEALSRMPEAARARSPDATRVAA